MNQTEFNRRQIMALLGSVAAMSGAGTMASAQQTGLKLWAPGIAKVGAQDWSDMEAQSGISINTIAKSARADESIQKILNCYNFNLLVTSINSG